MTLDNLRTITTYLKSQFLFCRKKLEWITINETIIKSVLKIKDINLAKKI